MEPEPSASGGHEQAPCSPRTRGTGTAAPAAVVAVLDDVWAAAVAAVMNLAGLDHRYPPLQG